MQSSVASKVSHLVLRRTPYRRPLSYCRLIQPRILLQTQDNQHNNDHVCIDNQHQPFSIENINSNDNSNNTREQQRRDYQRQPRRIHSTLASKSFWRGLHQAVRQGNGNHAEEIAEQVLRDYYRFSTPSGSEASALNSTLNSKSTLNSNSASNSAPSINDLGHDYNGTVTIESGTALLDSQIFSLVLQAWKNSDHGSLHSALRAHNLLIQMAALADQDVLCDPPTPGDYAAVLECWHRASENEGNADGASGRRRSDSNANANANANSNSNANGSIALIVQHAEELWSQMKERQRREAMTNKSSHFSIDEEAYELFASLLAKAGKAARAEQVVREAVAQQQQQQQQQQQHPSSYPQQQHAGYQLRQQQQQQQQQYHLAQHYTHQHHQQQQQHPHPHHRPGYHHNKHAGKPHQQLHNPQHRKPHQHQHPPQKKQ